MPKSLENSRKTKILKGTNWLSKITKWLSKGNKLIVKLSKASKNNKLTRAAAFNYQNVAFNQKQKTSLYFAF